MRPVGGAAWRSTRAGTWAETAPSRDPTSTRAARACARSCCGRARRGRAHPAWRAPGRGAEHGAGAAQPRLPRRVARRLPQGKAALGLCTQFRAWKGLALPHCQTSWAQTSASGVAESAFFLSSKVRPKRLVLEPHSEEQEFRNRLLAGVARKVRGWDSHKQTRTCSFKVVTWGLW